MIKATKKWIIIKISSLLLIPLMVWFIISFVSLVEVNNSNPQVFFSDFFTKIIMFLKLVHTMYAILHVLFCLQQHKFSVLIHFHSFLSNPGPIFSASTFLDRLFTRGSPIFPTATATDCAMHLSPAEP